MELRASAQRRKAAIAIALLFYPAPIHFFVVSSNRVRHNQVIRHLQSHHKYIACVFSVKLIGTSPSPESRLFRT